CQKLSQPREKAIKTAEKVAKNARQKRRLTKEIFVKTTIYSGARKMTTIADDLIHRTRAAFPAKAKAILLYFRLSVDKYIGYAL
ncbi:MAG: hypothetical protein IIT84_01990, partial [Oscillospiraceae bacterium]|nr:hypothetical protein [Oscillospiraceae bacterium]